ncbi:MAG: hypothetical protein IMF15_05250 [Proteobacteria bacterium]|nr:hypothetical protein [Pseudomonadota bacterium]
MKNILLLILIPLILTGCGARLVNASPEKVVIANVSKHTEGDADRIADEVCVNYSKQAFLVSNGSDGTATYKCIEPF